jgi:hypothetical protein
MPLWLYDIVYPVGRWLHLVCSTLIVGGTLFFELVLPIALEDLKREQQLYVFARARLVFRWVVWISVIGLLLTGGLSVYRQWYSTYANEYVFRWAVAHVLIGSVALAIPLLLTLGRQPPENPIRWMRLNLVILLVSIFIGSATRHFQLAFRERRPDDANLKTPDRVPWGTPTPDAQPATAPATAPGTQPATLPATQPETLPATQPG